MKLIDELYLAMKCLVLSNTHEDLYCYDAFLGMNKAIIASIAILVLMMGTASNTVFHVVEARSIPQHLLDSNSTEKGKFLLAKNGNSSEKQYPKIIGYTPF